MASHADLEEPDDRPSKDRLYQRLAQVLFDQLATERYAIGDRLPAERELSVEHGVSRPVVREALIALEVQGYIEVRLGAGAFVRRLPGNEDHQGFAITAFELTEARMVFEGEAAALAAVHITEEELDDLDALVEQIGRENLKADVTEDADREFHFAIAKATRNAAILMTLENYWRVRSTSPECALLHDKARSAKVRPVVSEHSDIALALRARDPIAARAAMRAHLSSVMEHLLFTTEELAVEKARRTAATTRERFSAVTQA